MISNNQQATEYKMQKKSKHKLSFVPTAYEESDKIISGKKFNNIDEKIEALEENRRKKDEKAILEILNDHSKGQKPLVKLASIESDTFRQALDSLLNIRNTEAFEVMMLLFEYMEKNNTYTIDKLTGTELLKLSKAKSIKQEKRHQKLRLLLDQSSVKLHVLDPKKSLENYKNKKNDCGLVYKIFQLLKIKEVTYSEKNPSMILSLGGIELLPEYIEHKHLISKRYLPLQTIRCIPEERGLDKSRHFMYKLCLKFASINKAEIILSLDECMNLGRFLNRNDRNIKKKWKPVEKALLHGKKIGLIDFSWTFKEPVHSEKHLFNISLFGEIIEPKYDKDGCLLEHYYRYIATVKIKRLYDLNRRINLPFDIEKVTPKKEAKGITLQL